MAEARERRRRRGPAGGERERPEPVGSLVERLLERWGIAEQVERASVLTTWDQLVGPRIAEVARPSGLRGGTLFIEVDSAAWRMELNMLRPELMRKLNAGRRTGRIEKLVFVQADESERRHGDGGTGGGAGKGRDRED